MKCFKCNRKIKLVNQISCRCNNVYCRIHKYPEDHSCSFNYKEFGKAALLKQNTLVTTSKITKI